MSYPIYYVIKDDTLPHLFDTFDGGDGSSITMSGLAVTDIKIYKDGGTTQRSSDAGYTLLDTDGIDFDGITGIHGFSIDLSDNTDAGFYAVGPWYHIVISSITVDAQTVNFVACAFRILDATRGMAGTALPDAAADAAGGIPISDAGGLDLDSKLANTNEVTVARMGTLTDWIDGGRLDLLLDAILTDTGTTLDTHLTDIKGGTFAGATDSLEAIRDRGDAAWTTGAGGSDRLLMVDTTIATLATQTSFTLTAGSADDNAYNNCTIVIEDVSTATQKAVGLISNYVGATKTVTLKYDPAVFTMAITDKVYILAENALKATLANRQLNVAADGDIAGNIDGSVDSVVGHTAQTGDSFARLGAPAGASIAADIAIIEGQTDDIGVAGAGLTAVPWNPAWDAEVESECNDALVAYDPPTKTEMDTAHGLLATEAKQDIISDNVDAILADTAEIGVAGAGLTGVGGLSNAAIDAIFDRNSSLGVSFEALMERTYQLLNNRQNITDATGAVVLRNIGNSADLASWTITDDDTDTLRTEVAWA